MAQTSKSAQAEASGKSDDSGAMKATKKKKGLLSTVEARREYQRQYYQKHKEKAKEYQRQYNLTHKKKARGRGRSGYEASREVVRSTFNTTDLMHSPVEKTIKMLEQIIKGERMFTM